MLVSRVVLSLKTSQKWNPPKKRRVTENEKAIIILGNNYRDQTLRKKGERLFDDFPSCSSGDAVEGK